jgi:hypothetical protein
VLKQFKPLHSQQTGVDQETAFDAGLIGGEKRFTTGIILDGLTILFQQAPQRLAELVVVTNDVDDRLTGFCATSPVGGAEAMDAVCNRARARRIARPISFNFKGLLSLTQSMLAMSRRVATSASLAGSARSRRLNGNLCFSLSRVQYRTIVAVAQCL